LIGQRTYGHNFCWGGIGGRKTARRRSFMARPFAFSSGVYQFRRKVPPELRAVLGHEQKRSLNTRDPAEAKAKHAQEWMRCGIRVGTIPPPTKLQKPALQRLVFLRPLMFGLEPN
jgi:hypothetical protein